MTNNKVGGMPVTSEINQLRMHKMLKKVGIDIDSFVDLFPPLKISQGVERCQSCDALDACDQHLDQAKVSVEDIDYCPNQILMMSFILRESFIKLSESDVRSLSGIATTHQYAKGARIYSEHDPSDAFYIILSGSVSVLTHQNDVEKELCILVKDDYFGEVAILNQDRHSISTKSIENSLILRIEKSMFIDFLRNNPEIESKINYNLTIRKELLILRECLLLNTSLTGKNLSICFKGDKSIRETAFIRERYESEVDKVLNKLQSNLKDMLLNRCVYRLFINFNSGEIRTASIFDPLHEEVHACDKLADKAYIERHFPPINYDEKAEMVKTLYQIIGTTNSFSRLPAEWKNIIGKSHNSWNPIAREEITSIIDSLSKLRQIETFYLANFSVGMIQDTVRIQFNCDGTHFINTASYHKFLQDNLQAE